MVAITVIITTANKGNWISKVHYCSWCCSVISKKKVMIESTIP